MKVLFRLAGFAVGLALTQVTTEPGESPGPQPANLLKLIEKWKTELAGKHKVRGDRLVLLFAAPEFPGNSLEAWVVPRGALLPDPNAKPAEETAENTIPADAKT